MGKGRTRVKSIKLLYDRLESLFYRLSVIGIFVMMVVVTGDSVGRYFLRSPIKGAFELVQNYLMVMTVFLSISYICRINAHIRLEMFQKFFPRQLKIVITYVNTLFPLAMFFIICHQATIRALEAWNNKEVMIGVVSWPVFWSYVWVPLGTGLVCVRLLFDLIDRPCRPTNGEKCEKEGQGR
jgi:TRAP-type C4-dicarboxylate transport system permease small subunit